MIRNRPYEIDTDNTIEPWRVFRRFTLEREKFI